jgi:IS30 family transposase
MGKTLTKHKLDARLSRKTMCKRELTILHRLRKILMLPVSSIATAVNRDKNTIYAALRRNQNANLARLGRPPAMTNAQVYSVIRTLRPMVKNAAAHREVTLNMLVKKKSKCKVSRITIYRELKKRNIKFHKLKCKPILTTEDKLNRFDFSKKYRKKPKAWWAKMCIGRRLPFIITII